MKAIVFDLDGTLLDTLNDLTSSVNYALEKCGFPLRSREEIKSFVGNGVNALIQRSLPDGVSDAGREKCLCIFRGHYLEHMNDNTAPYPGAKDSLKTLKKKGMKIAVVSNKLHEAVVELCEAHFGEEVDFCAGTKNESEKKPDPVIVFRALSKLGVSANEAVYIGDSEVDLKTAKNAGLKCISVTWGFRTRDELISYGAETILDDFEGLVKILTE